MALFGLLIRESLVRAQPGEPTFSLPSATPARFRIEAISVPWLLRSELVRRRRHRLFRALASVPSASAPSVRRRPGRCSPSVLRPCRQPMGVKGEGSNRLPMAQLGRYVGDWGALGEQVRGEGVPEVVLQRRARQQPPALLEPARPPAPNGKAHLLAMSASELPVRCSALLGISMHKDPGQ